MLVPEAQGRGYAVEAARAAHEWFDRVIPGKLVAQVAAVNISSLKLAAQLGYREQRREGEGGEAMVYLRRDGPPGGR